MGPTHNRPVCRPLFHDEASDDDPQSGTIYVLRSDTDHPLVRDHRAVLHKSGVTGGSVEARLAGADEDATYLPAGVEVVAYELFDINRRRLEALIHRLFAPAQIDLTVTDRFGNPVARANGSWCRCR